MNSIKKNIDWINHFVAFISSVVGIFIAFQLDDWQQNREEKEKERITLSAIKKELETNGEILKNNIKTISTWIDYQNFVARHDRVKGTTDQIVCSPTQVNKLLDKTPRKLGDLKLVKMINDTLGIYFVGVIHLNISLQGISTNNWEAAKYSGILNNFDHDQISALTAIYSLLNKDLGFSANGLYEQSLEENGQMSSPSIKEAILIYKKLNYTYQAKLDRLQEQWPSLKWDIK